MKVCFQGILLSLNSLLCFAQKPPLDSNAIRSWAYIMGAQISNNGYYTLYTIENQQSYKRSLVIQSTKNKWKIEVPESNGLFTSDSKFVIFKNEKDSLGIIRTGNNIVRYIPLVQSFSIPQYGNSKWLVYQLNNSQRTLKAIDLEARREKSFDCVKQYLLSEDGSTLLFLTEENENTITQALRLLNLVSGEIKTIWQGTKAGNFVISRSNKQVAITVEQLVCNKIEKTFWYYKTGMEKAIELSTNESIKNDSALQLESVSYFSEDDSCLFVSLKQKDFPKPQSSLIDVWSYTDVKLQSKQLNEFYSKTYKAVIYLQSSQLIRLENENERFYSPYWHDNNNINYWGLVVSRPGDPVEEQWNDNASISVDLIYLKDGRRIRIPSMRDLNAKLSPKCKYVIYYDPKQKNYFSYEIESGTIRNITKNIPVTWAEYYREDQLSSISSVRGIAGWLNNDEDVLIYDKNDIWQVDMAAKKAPINITSGYGKVHNIVFSLDLQDYNYRTISQNERLILTAFNLENKDNGYFGKTLSRPGVPELLTMGPYLYNIPGNPYLPSGSNFTPIKALYENVYLVRRMSANEAPNIFCTSDFKTFKPLSNVHPENKYNWLTAELVTWKALDGRSLQGILYKPENFDFKKKYPIIFNYYERKSDGLHAYLTPDYSSDDINIPWYTSNGYLVFLPDIYYKIGETGQSVINSVVSAAEYLSQKPWVNPKKMGIQGFSFGGYETNVLVTQSNLFAAACSASGLSNLASAYGGLDATGSSLQELIEFTQFRMGTTVWQRPDIYIKNSPVFRADQVTTPLLIMHTRQDPVCHFANAIEFFTALRRLNKKVWMLQYEGSHFPSGNAAREDFSRRLGQFFDHYLKGAPAPSWMIKGIPARLKGIDTGLEFIPN